MTRGAALLVALLASGCGHGGDVAPARIAGPAARPPAPLPHVPAAPSAPAPTSPETAVASPGAEPSVPAMASCLSSAAPTQVALTSVEEPVEVGERSFAYAWRWVDTDVTPVIVSLDDRGQPVETPLPIDYAAPHTLVVEPGALRIAYAAGGVVAMRRLALAANGALTVGPAITLAGVADGWPSWLASDGAQALLLQSIAAPDRSIRETITLTIDLHDGHVLATRPQLAGAVLDGRARTTLALDGSHATLLRHTAADERLTFDVAATCPTFYEIAADGGTLWVAPGAPWRGAFLAASAPFLRRLSFDASLADVPGCGRALYAFPAPGRPGMMDGAEGTRRLLRWSAATGRFGASEPLPPMTFEQSSRAAHRDGVIELGWNAGSGLVHSPSDTTVRRYFRAWHFDRGEVRLLHFDGHAWQALDPTPLPVHDAHGTMSEGYAPVTLRNGLYATVLITPDNQPDPGWLQPFRVPCTR